MDKFTKTGRKKKVSDIQETKNRVKERLMQAEEDGKHEKTF